MNAKRKPRVEYVIDERTGCWVWQLARTSHGYGVRRIGNKNYYAHRLYYERANGLIPDGLDICHKCDNPPCVNPDHLFAGTASDNALDMYRKGRHVSVSLKGADNGFAKLTEANVKEIRRLAAEGWKQRDIGARFGIAQTQVGNIVRRQQWAHVP